MTRKRVSVCLYIWTWIHRRLKQTYWIFVVFFQINCSFCLLFKMNNLSLSVLIFKIIYPLEVLIKDWHSIAKGLIYIKRTHIYRPKLTEILYKDCTSMKGSTVFRLYHSHSWHLCFSLSKNNKKSRVLRTQNCGIVWVRAGERTRERKICLCKVNTCLKF